MFNDPSYIKELCDFIEELGVKSVMQVDPQSTEIIDELRNRGICEEDNPELVFSSGVIQHHPNPKKFIQEIAKLPSKYILTLAPNSGCRAYKNAKKKTKEHWKNERDFTEASLAKLHQFGEVTTGTMGEEWAKKFGPEPSKPYLVYALMKLKDVEENNEGRYSDDSSILSTEGDSWGR